MKILAVLLVAILSVCGGAQTQPEVAVVATSHIKRAPSPERVARVLRFTSAELQLADRPLPNVLAFYMDRSTANVLLLDAGLSLAVVASQRGERTMYQAWIVDDTGDLATSLAMVNILNKHFQLGMDDGSIRRAAMRVQKRATAEIDVATLSKP